MYMPHIDVNSVDSHAECRIYVSMSVNYNRVVYTLLHMFAFENILQHFGQFRYAFSKVFVTVLLTCMVILKLNLADNMGIYKHIY